MNKIKTILNIGLCVFLVSLGYKAQAQKSKGGNYQISGQIKGLNNSKVFIIVYKDGANEKIDTLTTTSVGGKFELKGSTDKSRFVHLHFGEINPRKNSYFYLEPGKIKITGNVDLPDEIKISGTETNEAYTKTQEFLLPLYKRRSALVQKTRNLDEGTTDYKNLAASIKSKSDSVNSYKLSFIRQYPHSNISLGYLYVLQDNLPVGLADTLYTNLSSDLKTSVQGKYIGEKLNASKTVAIGKKAPDFTSSDTTGAPIKLSDFKGKYVLLEFWAHWCVPCRAQHPHMKVIYEKFKDKGFTILQYSIDVKKDEKKWKEAIVKDGLIWPQASDLSNGKAPVAELYGVQPIPDSFLISPDGTIIGRRLSHQDLENILSKKLN
ncbi:MULTISPECIES: TlpA disulfide reductase family protein [Sphingobacterium]|uniref:TlpA disulfide reductase family protein n=1 Tax=Sphingobacterium TaxID=28453 RepID=UPI00257EB8F4|nr:MULTISPECIES: TlpA disulfide reductase family protein [Sphingobacterium]